MGRSMSSPAVRLAQQNHKMSEEHITPFTPVCPAWLTSAAKEEWDAIVPELVRRQHITPMDVPIVAAYCATYAQWKQCTQRVEEEGIMIRGPRSMVLNPIARHANQTLSELRKLANEFGLSIASRSKIDVPPVKDEETDDLDTFNREVV